MTFCDMHADQVWRVKSRSQTPHQMSSSPTSDGSTDDEWHLTCTCLTPHPQRVLVKLPFGYVYHSECRSGILC